MKKLLIYIAAFAMIPVSYTHLDVYKRQIISKYLLGTASPQEEKEIMEWRNADAGHEQEFLSLIHISLY